MNALVWNVALLGRLVNGQLAIAVTGPAVDSWIVEHMTGQYPRAYVGKGFATKEQAMAYVHGDDGKGGLVYDSMFTITLECEVTGE